MINIIKDYFRKQLLRETSLVPQNEFSPFEKRHSVLFVYCLDSFSKVEDLNNIVDILDNTGLDYRGLIILCNSAPSKSEISKSNEELVGIKRLNEKLDLISRDDVDWIGVPKSNVLDNIKPYSSDIFICFNNRCNFTMEYLCKILQSNFKVALGNAIDESYFSFVLSQPKSVRMDMSQMLNEFLKYSKSFHNSFLSL